MLWTSECKEHQGPIQKPLLTEYLFFMNDVEGKGKFNEGEHQACRSIYFMLIGYKASPIASPYSLKY